MSRYCAHGRRVGDQCLSCPGETAQPQDELRRMAFGAQEILALKELMRDVVKEVVRAELREYATQRLMDDCARLSAVETNRSPGTCETKIEVRIADEALAKAQDYRDVLDETLRRIGRALAGQIPKVGRR